jgi:biotin-dependent carboxylase-like uncharacterized protein
MSHLQVIAPGLATTVQDLGRRGYQRLGIPVAGALDATALALANIAVGNPPDTAGLECLYQGPTLRVDADHVRLAVAGATASLEIEVAGQRQRIPAAQSVTLPRGATVRVIIGSPAISALLAVTGGIAVTPVMGSRSTYARAKLGGFEGRALRAGDRVPLTTVISLNGPDQRVRGADLPLPTVIRVVLGPQDDYAASAALEAFLSTPYTISAASDRMGHRLSGAVISGPKGYNIVSDGVPHGAIQVPGDGQPIILLADRQTTGGYPKIATVISVDLPGLGRVGPGAVLRFKALSVAAAEDVARAAAATRSYWRCEAVDERGSAGAVDNARLHDINLISGVVSGADEQ